MDTPASFSYSPLNPDNAEIRLVTIIPDKNEKNLVKCTLQTISLNDPPPFEALSYVWGSVAEKVEISVDSIPFLVTTNLEAALKCLRHARKKRLIWIDFICIDQENLKEKNTQIPLMGRIYKDATAVVAWLGPSNPNMEQAMSLIKKRESSSLSGLSGMLQDARQMMRSWGQKNPRHSIRSILDAVQGFLDIVTAPYWARMWTFQEYYLPTNLPVCMVGRMPFTLPALVDLGLHFRDLLSPFMEDIDRIAPRAGDEVDIEDHRKLQARLKEALQRLAQSNPMQDFAHDIAASRKGLSSFADVLDLTVHRQCYDPRDRFFALYSMVDGVQKKYPVDYENGVDEVALQVTLWILVFEGVDFVFNLFHFYEGKHGNILGRPSPSWVPNYRDSMARTRFRDKTIDPVLQDWEQKDHMTNLSLFFGPCRYVLHFWARTVGTVRVVFKFPEEIAEIAQRVLDAIAEPSVCGNGVDETNLAERLLGAFFDIQFPIDDILNALQQLSSDQPDSTKSPCEKQLRRDLPSLAGRTVFQLTDSPGGFGIGVGNLQDGDLLILSGKMTNPIALRDSGLRDEEKDDVVPYNMVGNTFLEGIAEDQKDHPTPLLGEILGREVREFLIA